jgi:hypothetical protein
VQFADRSPSVSHMALLVVNHWGGVPFALRGKVLSMHDFNANSEDVGLSSSDPIESFQTLVSAPFRFFERWKERGYYTVVLGATGLDPLSPPPPYSIFRASHDDCTFPDPRARFSHLGIDRCSTYDSASFRGNVLVHDEEVVTEAKRVLFEHRWNDAPLLLWINFLSCRDVTCVRVTPKSPPYMPGSSHGRESEAEDNCPDDRVSHCVVPAVFRQGCDERRLPRNLLCSTSTSSTLDKLERETFGEDCVAFDDELRIREYTTLLHIATSRLTQLRTLVTPLIVQARKSSTHVVMTATHSISLGEHRSRCSMCPTGVCSTTFWCCDEPRILPDRDRSTLRTCLRRLFERVAEGRISFRSVDYVPNVCRGQCGTTTYTRTVHRLNLSSARYSIVSSHDAFGVYTLVEVYDLDSDPEEVHNILPNVSHLLPRLTSAIEVGLRDEEEDDAVPCEFPGLCLPSTPPSTNPTVKDVVPPSITPSFTVPPSSRPLTTPTLLTNSLQDFTEDAPADNHKPKAQKRVDTFADKAERLREQLKKRMDEVQRKAARRSSSEPRQKSKGNMSSQESREEVVKESARETEWDEVVGNEGIETTLGKEDEQATDKETKDTEKKSPETEENPKRLEEHVEDFRNELPVRDEEEQIEESESRPDEEMTKWVVQINDTPKVDASRGIMESMASGRISFRQKEIQMLSRR